METDNVIELALVFSLVVVPALGITARIVLKPIVDALVRLKEGGVLPQLGAARMENEFLHLRDDVRQMREEMAQLNSSIASLREAEDFSRALREPAAPQLPPSNG
jgi:hypothetical protein